MGPVLALLFIVVPFLELFVILQVGQAIGVLPTVALLILVSVTGAWLVRREGLGVARRVVAQVQSGRVPGRELADGALIMFGGALLLTPGFLTDVLGMTLLVPPTRALIRAALTRWLSNRVVVRRW